MNRFLFAFLAVAAAEGIVILLYFSPLRDALSKPAMESVSLAAHAAAAGCFTLAYLRTQAPFFLWTALWTGALFWRDWHLLEHVVSKTLDSFSYYAVLAAALASGLFWKSSIAETLRRRRGLLAAWFAVFLFYGAGVLCDKRILTALFADHGLKLFENFLEEISETLGAFVLLGTALFGYTFRTSFGGQNELIFKTEN